MKKIITLSLFWLISATASTINAQISTADSLQLVNFYDLTGGDNWTNNNGWLASPISEWYGLEMDSSDSSKIIGIDLNTNNLVGTLLPLKLLALSDLLNLKLDHNQLSGAIPDFSSLPQLQKLSLHNNSLSGTIPDFSSLPMLKKLSLRDNQLTGNIPDFTNLPVLDYINFNYNQLSGAIPDFSQLPKIRNINIKDNQLSGSLPTFTQCPDIESLELKNNQITGSLPDYNHLQKLQTIDITSNQLSGIIPPLNLPELETFNLNDNLLLGEIPALDFPKLKELKLNNNELTGNVVMDLPALEIAWLYGNQLSDLQILSNSNLQQLGLHKNQFNFDDIEPYIGQAILFFYSPQACIFILHNDNTLSVSAGGTLAENTYTWYKDNNFYQEIAGDSTLMITENGTYHCEVSNNIATQLTLCTDAVEVEVLLCSAERDCVWPGDTNKDGTVDMHDLMNIGLIFNNIGLARSEQTSLWQSYFSEDWEDNFSNELNNKHADVNGDGIIEEQDVTMLLDNFLQNHDHLANVSNINITSEMPIHVKHEATVVSGTEEIFSLNLGSINAILQDIYGIAFKVRIQVADSTIRMNEPALDFENSWLKIGEDNLLTLDTIFKETPTEWIWHIGVTRSNRQSISGWGELCKILCIMEVASVDGKMVSDVIPIEVEMSIEQLVLTRLDGTRELLNNTEYLNIEQLTTTNFNSPEKIIETVAIFPNPLHKGQALNINTPYIASTITISNLQGQAVFRRKLSDEKTTLNLTNLPIGIYFIENVGLNIQQKHQQKLIVIE